MQTFWFWWFCASFATFIGPESYALYTGKMTLSAFVRGTGAAYPWVPPVVVIFMFCLYVHFWWVNK